MLADGAPAIANFSFQNIAARRRNEHARHVGSPDDYCSNIFFIGTNFSGTPAAS